MHFTVSRFLKLIWLVAFITALVISFFSYRVISTYLANYQSLLVFDAEVDYKLISDPQKTLKVPLLIENYTIKWPLINPGWDTALLKINVDSSTLGQRLSPSVSLSTQSQSIKQDFELGAKGVRYINVSPLSGSNISVGDRIKITKDNISSLSTDAELIVFEKNTFKNTDRFLILSPHPDDAEIAASGLYQQYSSNSWVVTVTAGDAGGSPLKHLFRTREEQYQVKGMLRVYDSVSIPEIAGIPRERIYNIGYFDGTLKNMFDDKTVSVGSKNLPFMSPQVFRKNAPFIKSDRANWKNLVHDLVMVIEDVQPTVIITPHPLLDIHADHQYTTIAVLEALQKQSSYKPKLLLYTNHTMTELYPHGDINSMITIPYMAYKKPVFDNLYSYQLSHNQRAIKLLSIDLMHDLKKIPSLESKDLVTYIKKAKTETMKGLRNPDIGYYRRSIRPNELFYVIENDSVETFAATIDACLNRQEALFLNCE